MCVFVDFHIGQESLTTIEWILRAVVGFIFLVVVAKVMGQRSISQLRFLDFVIALLIGNIIAHPLSDEGLGLKGSILTMGALVTMYVGGVQLSLRWTLIRKFFDPSPLTLIKDGEIHYKNLNKARISIDILLAELRKEKTESIQKVALALWEPGGTISVFLQPQHQPITHADMSIQTSPFELPTTIIKERRIEYTALHKLGKNEQWLLEQLNQIYNAKSNDILLATIDNNEKLTIFFY